jgi:glucokinase
MVDQAFRVVFKRDIDAHAPSLVVLINDFLRDAASAGYTTDTCCLAVAGPVEKNKCLHLTNAAYHVDDEEIIRGSLLRNVLVINDFAAIGAAVASMHVDNPALTRLAMSQGTAEPDPTGNRAILGPGTGLGVSYLPRVRNGYFVVPSEGGHAYAPYLARFRGLLEYVRHKRAADQLDVESLVSGQGIRAIARYFLDHPQAMLALIEEHAEYRDERALLKKSVDRHATDVIRKALDHEHSGVGVDAAAVISRNFDTCVAARMTIRVFNSFLGAAAQDVALHGYATGGLFIGGGIARNNLSAFAHGDFMRSFLDHVRPSMRDFLRKIPVYVITDYDVSFLGCAAAAKLAFVR